MESVRKSEELFAVILTNVKNKVTTTKMSRCKTDNSNINLYVCFFLKQIYMYMYVDSDPKIHIGSRI